MGCPLNYRCGCSAQVKLITGADYKRLEFSGTHDSDSHAKGRSKTLTHDQIALIYDAVVIAPHQSGTKLRRNLCQAKGSPESYKHMAPSMIRTIQRRVKSQDGKGPVDDAATGCYSRSRIARQAHRVVQGQRYIQGARASQ